jgi:tRNA(Ile2) C34 agmatinyltransferase TiaS
MDATRCPHCNKRMKVVATSDGRTDFQCLQCDKVDPLQTDAVKWAASPLAAPTKAA